MQAENSVENIKVEKQVDLWKSYSYRKEKSSIARVWIKAGKGSVIVNGRNEDNYFSSKSHRLLLNQPLVLTNRKTEIDVVCTVKGEGYLGKQVR